MYVISEEILWGSVGDKLFVMKGVSGGGRGGNNPQYSVASYDPRKKTKGNSGVDRGGPIPPGLWWIYPPQWKDNKHPSLGPWVSYVKPTGNQLKYYKERTGFFIHSPGPRGSDGCLVISRDKRIALLKAIESVNGVALEVTISGENYSPQDLFRYIERCRNGLAEA